MSTDFNQDDIFNAQGEAAVDPGASMFENSQASAPASKQQGAKKIAGMPLSTWALVVGAALFVLFMVSRLFSNGGASSADEGQLEPIADASMTLEPEASATAEPESKPQAASVAIAPQQLSLNEPAASAEHAADPAPVAPAINATRAVVSPPDAPEPINVTAKVQPQLPTVPATAVAGEVSAAPTQLAQVTTETESTASRQELDAVRKQVAELQQEVANLKRGQGLPAPQRQSSRRAVVSAESATSAKAKVRAQSASQTKQQLPPVSGVSLRAVVGDVAWVQTVGGESVQVRPGDVIPGVGTVKTISAETAEVRLEDGRSLN